MKKDIVYPIKMTSSIRKALNGAVRKNCRSISSLLNEILTDYLEKEGLLIKEADFFKERRKFPRKKVIMPAMTFLEVGLKCGLLSCVVLDILMAGARVIYPKNFGIIFTSKEELPHFRLCLEHLLMNKELDLNCETLHLIDTKYGNIINAIFSNPRRSDLKRLISCFM